MATCDSSSIEQWVVHFGECRRKPRASGESLNLRPARKFRNCYSEINYFRSGIVGSLLFAGFFHFTKKQNSYDSYRRRVASERIDSLIRCCRQTSAFSHWCMRPSLLRSYACKQPSPKNSSVRLILMRLISFTARNAIVPKSVSYVRSHDRIRFCYCRWMRNNNVGVMACVCVFSAWQLRNHNNGAIFSHVVQRDHSNRQNLTQICSAQCLEYNNSTAAAATKIELQLHAVDITSHFCESVCACILHACSCLG